MRSTPWSSCPVRPLFTRSVCLIRDWGRHQRLHIMASALYLWLRLSPALTSSACGRVWWYLCNCMVDDVRGEEECVLSCGAVAHCPVLHIFIAAHGVYWLWCHRWMYIIGSILHCISEWIHFKVRPEQYLGTFCCFITVCCFIFNSHLQAPVRRVF